MDAFLIKYLKSGKAWVLVGSGPSIEAGYPSWQELARIATENAYAVDSTFTSRTARLLSDGDYPAVFTEAERVLGAEHLASLLDATLSTHRVGGEIYRLLARWPVEVFLTTNFDDALAESLAAVGVAYTTLSNSRDHMGRLNLGLSGTIVKLHGDLRSPDGRILTSIDYRRIREDPAWRYWRDRLKSIVQVCPVVIVGHSLTDPHISHLLRSAKEGAAVTQPICWLAPDVPATTAREFLEQYRIHVITYPNSDGTHRALGRVLHQVDQFIPRRTSIAVRRHIAAVAESPLGKDAGAPGFFVYNRLSKQSDSDTKRLDIAVAAIEAVSETLLGQVSVTVESALKTAGWPLASMPSPDFLASVANRALERGVLEKRGAHFKISVNAAAIAGDQRRRFQEMRDRFVSSVSLRARRLYPTLDPSRSNEIAADLEASLAGFFREGGLALATTLHARIEETAAIVPSSILRFVTESANRYSDLLSRQVFVDVSIDVFTRSEIAEREYLGRLAQGFFGFHALGVFGDVAAIRARDARETVWLLDSHIQIPALALGARTHEVFSDTLRRLAGQGVRLFTLKSLFEETYEHFWFASQLVARVGASSADVLLAARGETPYAKSNQFLQGYLAWQAREGARGWEEYLFAAFGKRRVTKREVQRRLEACGIEIVDFQAWPGFATDHFAERDALVDRIARLRETAVGDPAGIEGHRRKAPPEAEAFLAIRYERAGQYHVISEGESPAWFISDTNVLNRLGEPVKVTWPPESFLRFASTLAPSGDEPGAESAFDVILWTVARSGVDMVSEEAVTRVFGGIVDDAEMTLREQRQIYQETLEAKYGATGDAVLEKISVKERPIAAQQLINEMLAGIKATAQAAAVVAARERERAERAERALREFKSLKGKLFAQREKRKRARRKSKRHAKSKKK